MNKVATHPTAEEFGGCRPLRWRRRFVAFVTFSVLTLALWQSATASTDEGITAYRNGDFINAFVDLLPAAEKGNVDAQYLLGLMYLDGKGVPQNQSSAVSWLRAAANQNLAEAQYRLAIYLLTPNDAKSGVSEDVTKEALLWLERAGQLRHRDALYRLATYQLNPNNANANNTAGVVALQQAAELGQVEGQYKLAGYYLTGYKNLIPQDFSIAAKWYRLAAQANHPKSAFALAYMLDQGIGIRRNRKKAIQWYEKAAESGLVDAQNNLAVLYANGSAGKSDPIKAYVWFSIAASQGSKDAAKALPRASSRLRGKSMAVARNLLYRKIRKFNGLEIK